MCKLIIYHYRKKTITIHIPWTKYDILPINCVTPQNFFTNVSLPIRTSNQKIYFSFPQIGKCHTMLKR